MRLGMGGAQFSSEQLWKGGDPSRISPWWVCQCCYLMVTLTAKGDPVWQVGDGRDPEDGKCLCFDSVGG